MTQDKDPNSTFKLDDEGNAIYVGSGSEHVNENVQAAKTNNQLAQNDYDGPTEPSKRFKEQIEKARNRNDHSEDAKFKTPIINPVSARDDEPLTIPVGLAGQGHHVSDLNASSLQSARLPNKVTVGWLVIINGPGKGTSFPLSVGVNSIGRASTNDVVLNYGDNKISRDSVCEVNYEQTNNEYFIVRGKTDTIPLINGKTLRSDSDLVVSDVIKVGGTELIFVPLCNEKFQWDWE
ncbi:MAG: FHA domain-containing protein [Paraglaciecola sp.]|uniref:FHA domain-containing protein n=1 Tax=Paraglaciecola sp. TaxID=1920173 RepID=UPI003298070E